MPTIALEHATRHDTWQLHLNPAEVVLLDSAGQVSARIGADDGIVRFLFPTWFGVKNFGIKSDDGNIRWFVPDRSAINEIKAHLDHLMPGRGPSALANRQLQGWLWIGAGGAVATLGVVAILASLAFGRFSRLFLLLFLAGGAIGSRGIVLLNRRPQVRASHVTAAPSMDWAPAPPPPAPPPAPKPAATPPGAVAISCPGCRASMLCPANAIGRNVRCAKCQNVFAARAPEPVEDVLPVDDPAVSPHGIRSRPGQVAPLSPASAPRVTKEAQPKMVAGIPLLWIGVGGGAAVLLVTVLCCGLGLFLLPSRRAVSTDESDPIVRRAGPRNRVDPVNPSDPNDPPAKKEPLALPPFPTAVAIKPPALAQNTVVYRLPETIGDLAVGGGGRYLVLHLPRPRQLAVFDVSEAKVTHQIAVPDANPRFAVGMNHMVVILPGSSKIQRWNLANGQREAEANIEDGNEVIGACMGSASAGPVLVSRHYQRGFGNYNMQLYDAVSLKPLPENWNTGNRILGTGYYLRASADGRTFAMRDGVGGEPHSMRLLTLAEDESKVQEVGAHTSVAVPSSNGSTIYGGYAVYNDRLQPVYPNPPPQSSAKPFIPAADGSPYFLRLDYTQWDQLGGRVAVFEAGKTEPFAEAGPFEGVSNEQIAYGKNRDSLTHDQRLIFLPKARLIVSIPKAGERLVLHSFDPRRK